MLCLTLRPPSSAVAGVRADGAIQPGAGAAAGGAVWAALRAAGLWAQALPGGHRHALQRHAGRGRPRAPAGALPDCGTGCRATPCMLGFVCFEPEVGMSSDREPWHQACVRGFSFSAADLRSILCSLLAVRSSVEGCECAGSRQLAARQELVGPHEAGAAALSAAAAASAPAWPSERGCTSARGDATGALPTNPGSVIWNMANVKQQRPHERHQ